MKPSPGTRIRLNDRCVWVERRGAEGVVVAPPSDGAYPQPGKHEVLILLDDDPHPRARDLPRVQDGWTCVENVGSVDVLE